MWRKIGLKSESPNKELSAQFSKRTQSKSQNLLNKSQANKSGLQNSRILSVQISKGSQQQRLQEEPKRAQQEQSVPIKIQECREQQREERCELGKQLSQIRQSTDQLRGSLQFPQLDRRSSLLHEQNSRLKNYIGQIQTTNFQLSSTQAALLEQLAHLQACHQTQVSELQDREAQRQTQRQAFQAEMQALLSKREALQTENSEFSQKLNTLTCLNNQLNLKLLHANSHIEDLRIQIQKLSQSAKPINKADSLNTDKHGLLAQQVLALRQSLALQSAAKIALQSQIAQLRQLNRHLQTMTCSLKQQNQKHRMRQSRISIVLRRSLLLLGSLKAQANQLKANLSNQSKNINKHLYYCTAQIWLRLQQLAYQLAPHDFLMRSRVVMPSVPLSLPTQTVTETHRFDLEKTIQSKIQSKLINISKIYKNSHQQTQLVSNLAKLASPVANSASPEKLELRFGLKQDYNMSSRVNSLIQKYKKSQIT